MKRALRLLSLWDWLPTFRAVAEHSHVSRAAAELGVSPSAVSRMIGLLEDDIGQPLFDRVGRSIQLNPAGEHLLAGVRTAMRVVDESLAIVEGTELSGPLRIVSDDPFPRAFVLPAVQALRRAHPGLTPSLRTRCGSEGQGDDITQLLLTGAADVGFVREASPHDQLGVERLGALPTRLYCGPGHPLFGASSVAISDVLTHDFLATSKAPEDGWPVEYRRRVVLTLESSDMAAEICAAGELLAVLPEVVATSRRERLAPTSGGGRDLWPLPIGLRPLPIYAVWRRRIELPGRADALIAAARAQLDMAQLVVAQLEEPRQEA
ncbi:MAG: LysR family transcriptional regulator [Myxococcales bacterium]|nr:LysR family transcriptional regulator [Myxococcales bacterium]